MKQAPTAWGDGFRVRCHLAACDAEYWAEAIRDFVESAPMRVKRALLRFGALLLGNIPGMPRALKAEYRKAALENMHPLDRQLPSVFQELEQLQRGR